MRSSVVGLAFVMSTTAPPAVVFPDHPEKQTNTLNIYDDGSVSNDTGTLGLANDASGIAAEYAIPKDGNGGYSGVNLNEYQIDGVSNNANTGGTCFGDSGGPLFYGNSDTVLFKYLMKPCQPFLAAFLSQHF